MIEKETELNEGGTVWSDRKVRLEICIRNKNASKKSPARSFSLSVRFLFNLQPLLVHDFSCKWKIFFFSDGFCKGKGGSRVVMISIICGSFIQ